jgi:hypothetical protein
MPHDLCMKNITLFSRDVLPHLQDLWDDEWEDRWWPQSLRQKRPVAAPATAAAS